MIVDHIRVLTLCSFLATGTIVPAQTPNRASAVTGANRQLAAGEIQLSIIDASEPSHGVSRALVCVAELVPTPSTDWLVANDRGELVAANLPPKTLHVWIDQVGFVGQMIEIDASVKRSKGVRVTLARNLNDPRKEPHCPSPQRQSGVGKPSLRSSRPVI